MKNRFIKHGLTLLTASAALLCAVAPVFVRGLFAEEHPLAKGAFLRRALVSQASQTDSISETNP